MCREIGDLQRTAYSAYDFANGRRHKSSFIEIQVFNEEDFGGEELPERHKDETLKRNQTQKGNTSLYITVKRTKGSTVTKRTYCEYWA